jgi:bacterioferritin (cytochrome b1)
MHMTTQLQAGQLQKTQARKPAQRHKAESDPKLAMSAELQRMLDTFAGRELAHALRRRRHAHACKGEFGRLVARRLATFSDAAMRRVDALAKRIRDLGGCAELSLPYESAVTRESDLDAIVTNELIEALASADALRSVERYLGEWDPASLCLIRVLRDEHERELAELSRMLDVILSAEDLRVCA